MQHLIRPRIYFLWGLLAVLSVPRAAARHTYTSVASVRQRSQAAVAVPPIIQNLAKGSALKCLADLTGGLVSP